KIIQERGGAVWKPVSPFFSSLRFLPFPFVTGVIGLALEILWVRTLVCVVSNNTYSFAVVLADVLTGLALGAWLYALIGPSRATPQSKAFVFLLVEVAAAVFIIGSLTSLNHLHDITLDLSRWVGGNHWLGLGLVRLGAAAVVTLIPAMASGFVAPLLVDLLRDQTEQSVDSLASIVFAANTLGSMTGAFTGGLVLIPLLGLSHGMVFLAILSIAIGLLMFFSMPPADRTRLTTGCVLVTAALLVVLFSPKELTLTKWYDRFENV